MTYKEALNYIKENSKNKIIVVICNVYLEMVRIMPQLVLLFLFLNISMKVDIA